MDYWIGKDGGILDPPVLTSSVENPRRVRIVDFATSLESPIPGIPRSWYLPRMLNPQKESNQKCVVFCLALLVGWLKRYMLKEDV